MKIGGLLVIFLIVMMSCQQQQRTEIKYYNIDSLITSQLDILNSIKPSITKVATIDSTQDQSTFTPDSTLWANELAVYRHLDVINKPIYVDAYNVSDEQDSNSNLKVRAFTAIKDVPLKSLRIYYQDTPDKVKRIEASLNEQNSLYYSSRKFSIELDDLNNQMALIRFSVEGTQKMILRDSVNFSISTKVNY